MNGTRVLALVTHKMGISSIKQRMSDFWFNVYWIVVSNYYNLFYSCEEPEFTFPEWRDYDFDKYWDKEMGEFFLNGLDEENKG